RVGKWLRSPKPAGVRSYKGAEVRGTWEPIIEPELRLQVMRAIAERGNAGGRDPSPKHLLSGLLFCGKCGQRMKAMGFVMKNGRTFPRFQCVKNPATTNCGGVATSEKALDAHVVSELIDFLSHADLAPLPDERRAEELRTGLVADHAAMADLTR